MTNKLMPGDLYTVYVEVLVEKTTQYHLQEMLRQAPCARLGIGSSNRNREILVAPCGMLSKAGPRPPIVAS